MNLKGIMLSLKSQTKKYIQISCDFTYEVKSEKSK